MTMQDNEGGERRRPCSVEPFHLGLAASVWLANSNITVSADDPSGCGDHSYASSLVKVMRTIMFMNGELCFSLLAFFATSGKSKRLEGICFLRTVFAAWEYR
jgi:hypothetical protein